MCAACGLDCHSLFLCLRPLSADRRREVLDATEFGKRITQVRYRGIVRKCEEGDLWQADHIRAVADGGGEATSRAAYQTLCTACHLKKTNAEKGRRAKGRAATK